MTDEDRESAAGDDPPTPDAGGDDAIDGTSATGNAGHRAADHVGRALARATGVGLACYLAVYATVGGLFALDFTTSVAGRAGGGAVEAVRRLGWVVYNAHLVPTRVWLSVNVIELSAESLALPPAVYYAVPPLVLFAGGWTAALRAPPGAWRVVAGAGIVLGYLPAAVLGAVATTTPAGGPVFVTATLLAGVAYPVAFGTVGALVADR
ncbi:MAG: hypothetical protein V5A23_02910 [Halobacteriales archaeon]